jgi:hypothetical protein
VILVLDSDLFIFVPPAGADATDYLKLLKPRSGPDNKKGK